MRFTRREFAQKAAISTLGVLAIGGRAAASEQPLVFLAPEKTEKHTALGILDLERQQVRRVATDAAGHSVAGHPRQRNLVFMFAQRPGTRSWLIDIERDRVVQAVDSAANRYFYGHGAFSTDGDLLYATENNLVTGEGMITIRRFPDLTLVDEFPSYGVGPHDMVMVNGGKSLLIANGGDVSKRRTTEEPQTGSKLSLVDIASRELIFESRLETSSYSIRHLSVDSSGAVALGLMNVWRRNRGSFAIGFDLGRTLVQPDVAPLLGRYPGLKGVGLSPAINVKTGIAAFTNSQDGCSFWRIAKKPEFISFLPLRKAQGACVTPDQRAFMVTGRGGAIVRVDASDPTQYESLPGLQGLNYKHLSHWRI